ncbi:MAG: SAM-dependent methyltransferase [Oscillospiraceae bacterium]
MEQKASITALMSAFVRAYHAETEENPVFNDNIAKKMFTGSEYEQMKSYIVSGADFFAPKLKGENVDTEKLLDFIVNTQLAPTPVVRAKYCEERLKNEVMTGTKQYVILGAGYDTFAWREPELMKKLSVFETDHPLTQTDKRERLSRSSLEIPHNFHFVPLDFTKDSLKEKLISSGFDLTKKTFFSWLGVSYYLTDEQIRKTLSEISSFAAEGSTIVFDYADSGLFGSDIQRVKNMLAMASAGGEPMKFCCDSLYLAKLLEDCNFLVYEELTPDDIDFKYLNDSDMTAFEHINYVTAVLKGTERINTKEKILQTSLRLFARRGYDSVSVRDISGELGITQAALYKHYKNKQDIFNSILKRMEANDKSKAAENFLPENSFENSPDSYKSIKLEDLKRFTLAMFRYWTDDAFASSFRKMLALEQYRSAEMAKLYGQYLSDGPLSYTEDLLREMGCKNPKQKALEFYAPVFMLINMYDSAEDKDEIYKLAEKHIYNFKLEELK